jgi:HK97 family phage portal protein
MLLTSLVSNPGARIEEDRQASPRAEYPSKYGMNTIAQERVTVENSQSIASAYRAKNIISDDVAKMPLKQYQRAGRNLNVVEPDPVTYNNAYLLQVSPNQWGWTPFLFKKSVVEWQLFYGNAYIWSPLVFPRQKLILPANRTVPVFDVQGNLWYRHTFSNNQTEYIPAVEILHLLINPDETGFVGRGVIQYARETFGKQLAARKTQSQFYGQGLNPAAYVQVNAVLDREGRNAYRDAYTEAIGGTNNAYKLAVFDNRITKFEPITMQPKDAQFLESIEATDVDIANFFGMPLHMLNRGKESYNSNEQKYIEYLQGTLDAYLVAWEEGARIKWLTQPEQADNFFKFNRGALLRMDAKARAETNEIRIRSGQMTPNEARSYDDLNPYNLGDEFYMTSNYAPVRAALQPQPEAASQPMAGDDTDE